jgi:fatty acid desaturase
MGSELDRLDCPTEDLEGSGPLAAVRGEDFRRHLPKHLFVKRPRRFLGKFWFAFGLIGLGFFLVINLSSFWIMIPVGLGLGLLYAHLIELQHETLHEHAFRSRRLNRIYGIACGIFMLSSYSAYKYEHLRHHASLGKPGNREFFNYRFNKLDSSTGFIQAAFHLGRYVDVFKDMGRSIFGLPFPSVTRARDAERIRVEYRLFALTLGGSILYTVWSGNLIFLWAWWLPTLLVAEPAHFLIEMPEHFGLNTQSNPDVLSNTRTIKAGRFAEWLTNFNNLHTAHHFHQGVPMAQARELHQLVTPRICEVEVSYFDFYRKVLSGEIRYENPADTCMTR